LCDLAVPRRLAFSANSRPHKHFRTLSALAISQRLCFQSFPHSGSLLFAPRTAKYSSFSFHFSSLRTLAKTIGSGPGATLAAAASAQKQKGQAAACPSSHFDSDPSLLHTRVRHVFREPVLLVLPERPLRAEMIRVHERVQRMMHMPRVRRLQ